MERKSILLKSNERSLSPNRLECSVCKQRFWMTSKYLDHMASHKHLLLSCNICNESFYNQKLLDEHYLTHNDVINTYDCTKCTRKFLQQHQLEQHILFHPLSIGNLSSENTKKRVRFNNVLESKDISDEDNLVNSTEDNSDPAVASTHDSDLRGEYLDDPDWEEEDISNKCDWPGECKDDPDWEEEDISNKCDWRGECKDDPDWKEDTKIKKARSSRIVKAKKLFQGRKKKKRSRHKKTESVSRTIKVSVGRTAKVSVDSAAKVSVDSTAKVSVDRTAKVSVDRTGFQPKPPAVVSNDDQPSQNVLSNKGMVITDKIPIELEKNSACASTDFGNKPLNDLGSDQDKSALLQKSAFKEKKIRFRHLRLDNPCKSKKRVFQNTQNISKKVKLNQSVKASDEKLNTADLDQINKSPCKELNDTSISQITQNISNKAKLNQSIKACGEKLNTPDLKKKFKSPFAKLNIPDLKQNFISPFAKLNDTNTSQISENISNKANLNQSVKACEKLNTPDLKQNFKSPFAELKTDTNISQITRNISNKANLNQSIKACGEKLNTTNLNQINKSPYAELNVANISSTVSVSSINVNYPSASVEPRVNKQFLYVGPKENLGEISSLIDKVKNMSNQIVKEHNNMELSSIGTNKCALKPDLLKSNSNLPSSKGVDSSPTSKPVLKRPLLAATSSQSGTQTKTPKNGSLISQNGILSTKIVNNFVLVKVTPQKMQEMQQKTIQSQLNFKTDSTLKKTACDTNSPIISSISTGIANDSVSQIVKAKEKNDTNEAGSLCINTELTMKQRSMSSPEPTNIVGSNESVVKTVKSSISKSLSASTDHIYSSISKSETFNQRSVCGNSSVIPVTKTSNSCIKSHSKAFSIMQSNKICPSTILNVNKTSSISNSYVVQTPSKTSIIQRDKSILTTNRLNESKTDDVSSIDTKNSDNACVAQQNMYCNVDENTAANTQAHTKILNISTSDNNKTFTKNNTVQQNISLISETVNMAADTEIVLDLEKTDTIEIGMQNKSLINDKNVCVNMSSDPNTSFNSDIVKSSAENCFIQQNKAAKVGGISSLTAAGGSLSNLHNAKLSAEKFVTKENRISLIVDNSNVKGSTVSTVNSLIAKNLIITAQTVSNLDVKLSSKGCIAQKDPTFLVDENLSATDCIKSASNSHTAASVNNWAALENKIYPIQSSDGDCSVTEENKLSSSVDISSISAATETVLNSSAENSAIVQKSHISLMDEHLNALCDTKNVSDSDIVQSYVTTHKIKTLSIGGNLTAYADTKTVSNSHIVQPSAKIGGSAEKKKYSPMAENLSIAKSVSNSASFKSSAGGCVAQKNRMVMIGECSRITDENKSKLSAESCIAQGKKKFILGENSNVNLTVNSSKMSNSNFAKLSVENPVSGKNIISTICKNSSKNLEVPTKSLSYADIVKSCARDCYVRLTRIPMIDKYSRLNISKTVITKTSTKKRTPKQNKSSQINSNLNINKFANKNTVYVLNVDANKNISSKDVSHQKTISNIATKKMLAGIKTPPNLLSIHKTSKQCIPQQNTSFSVGKNSNFNNLTDSNNKVFIINKNLSINPTISNCCNEVASTELIAVENDNIPRAVSHSSEPKIKLSERVLKLYKSKLEEKERKKKEKYEHKKRLRYLELCLHQKYPHLKINALHKLEKEKYDSTSVKNVSGNLPMSSLQKFNEDKRKPVSKSQKSIKQKDFKSAVVKTYTDQVKIMSRSCPTMLSTSNFPSEDVFSDSSIQIGETFTIDCPCDSRECKKGTHLFTPSLISSGNANFVKISGTDSDAKKDSKNPLLEKGSFVESGEANAIKKAHEICSKFEKSLDESEYLSYLDDLDSLITSFNIGIKCSFIFKVLRFCRLYVESYDVKERAISLHQKITKSIKNTTV